VRRARLQENADKKRDEKCTALPTPPRLDFWTRIAGMRPRNLLLALAVLAGVTATADARRSRTMGGEKYVANGKFGLGLELGVPFGLNGKYFLNDSHALNFGFGYIYDHYYTDARDGGNVYLDFLWHPFSITNQEAFQLPFFVGVGGRIWNFNGCNGCNNGGDALGVRVPVGIAFDFNKVPLDIFIQLTFVADLFFNYDRNDRFGPHIEGSVGIRYWF
jgi:hypothetical protein